MNLESLAQIPPWEWPEGASTAIHAVLTDPQSAAGQRLLAADLAAELCAMDDRLAEALLAVAESAGEHHELRCAAALSLGPILEYTDTVDDDDTEDAVISVPCFRRVVAALKALYDNEALAADLRRSVLMASARAPRAWHQTAVRAAHESADPAWHAAAVTCMITVPGFEAEIVAALASDNPGVRFDAVVAAGEWAVDAAWPDVVAILGDAETDKALLIEAIEAVAAIRPDEAPEVLDAFLDSPDEEIAEAAECAVSMADAILEADADDGEDEFDEDLDGESDLDEDDAWSDEWDEDEEDEADGGGEDDDREDFGKERR